MTDPAAQPALDKWLEECAYSVEEMQYPLSVEDCKRLVRLLRVALGVVEAARFYAIPDTRLSRIATALDAFDREVARE